MQPDNNQNPNQALGMAPNQMSNPMPSSPPQPTSVSTPNQVPNSMPNPAPQPIPNPTPEPVLVSTASPAPESVPKKKKTGLIVGIIVGVIAVIGIVVAIIIVMKGMGGGVVSVDKIREYCNQNGLSVSDTSTKIDSVVDAVICEGESSSIKDGVLGIQYYKLDRPALEVEEYSVANLAAVATLDLLVDSGEYKKYYTDMSSGVLYYIFDRNSLMIVYAKDEKDAKDFLLGLGYPDDKWETEMTNSGEKTDDIGKNGEQEGDPLLTRRDTARRNDLSRLDTSLVQYQTNNLGALPTGPSYWKGVATIKCESGDVACNFVRDYLNTSYSNNEIKNEFMDPGGTPYSLYITENWVDNESVTPIFGNTNSFLVVNGDGYTIGGDSPFSEHVIYVIPGGVCSEDTIVKSTNARQFGILYMLESGTINCLDDR